MHISSHAVSWRLIALAITAALGLAAPAFASNNESHTERHAEQGHDDTRDASNDDHHSENHGSTSDASNNGHHSENHGNPNGSRNGRSVLKTTLIGTVEPNARGKAKLNTKPRGTQFEAEVKIPVPSTGLALADKLASQEATLVLTLSRAGVAYAECDFDWMALTRKAGTISAKYKIQIYNRGGVVQERAGLCDIDLTTAGAQSGTPTIQRGDTATVTIDTNDAVFLEGTF